MRQVTQEALRTRGNRKAPQTPRMRRKPKTPEIQLSSKTYVLRQTKQIPKAK